MEGRLILTGRVKIRGKSILPGKVFPGEIMILKEKQIRKENPAELGETR